MEAAEVANGVGNEGTIDKAVVTTDEVEDLMAREEINVTVFGRAVVETIPEKIKPKNHRELKWP